MSKYTPGPWHGWSSAYVMSSENVLIASVTDGKSHEENEKDIQSANVQLISAAPELAAGLLQAFAFIDGLNHYGVMPENVVQPEMKMISAALKKAGLQ